MEASRSAAIPITGLRQAEALGPTWDRVDRSRGVILLEVTNTFASWAIQRGATLPELKDLLGHSSLAMVMRYAHLSPEHLRSAVSRLEGVLTPAEAAVPEHDLVSEHAANHSSDHT